MRAPREQDLVNACLAFLQLRGIPAWRQNQGAVAGTYSGRRRFVRFCSAKGVSDVLGILPPAGRMLAVEVKQPGRKPTPDQAAFLEQVRRAGGLGVVVHDLAELQAALE